MTIPVTPPEGTPPATPPIAPATPPVDTEEDKLVALIKADPSRTADEIRALRKEAETNRQKAKKAEEDAQAAEATKLKEQGEYKTLAEKQAEEIKALKDGQRAGEIRSAVLLEASRVGIADPADALKLADLSKVDLGEGGVTGAAEAVAALVKAKPYLVKSDQPAKPNIGASNPAGGPGLTAKDLAKMTATEIKAMSPDDVAAALLRK